MHQPVIVWWWIWILTQLNGYSRFILCTVHCDIGRLVHGKFWLQAVHHSIGDWSVCHIYALSFLYVASYHNYTKLNMCIWLWCVTKNCPWLSNSTLTVILILLHSMTEHVLGPYWWGCTASALSWLWGSMTRFI